MLINVPFVIQQNNTIKKNPSIYIRFQVSLSKLSPLIYSNGMELFTLILVDSYCGWFEFNTLKDMTSKSVITLLKRHFTNHGTPQVLITDNTRQYTSNEFEKFSHQWNFEHVTSSTRYPQVNFAEETVKRAKSLLTRCEKDNSDVYYGLLMLRNTPRDGHLKSQADKLFLRKKNKHFPIHHKYPETPIHLWRSEFVLQKSNAEEIP